MQYRLKVEAPGGPTDVRFLHVLQGADAGTGAGAVTLLESSDGTPFAGALVDDTAVLFPVNLDTPFSTLTYSVPGTTQSHLIAGLAPDSGYDVVTQTVRGELTVTITPGTMMQTDSGGVLVVGETAVSNVGMFLPLITRW